MEEEFSIPCKRTDIYNIENMLSQNTELYIAAPMVRYSKVQFRNLVKLYGCHLTFTPMIMADSFCKSEKARQNEFTTNYFDNPVIIQFAANTIHDFVGAAHLASPYVSGVDLNCGCPQSWAKKLGVGCCLLNNPQKVFDIVHQCRNQTQSPFSVSVKMRLLSNIKQTVEYVRMLDHCRVSFITVHARKQDQNSGPINEEALKIIRQSTEVPIIANGGIKSLEDVQRLSNQTHCRGYMVANALLSNPMLFDENPTTTITSCVQDWLNICYNTTLTVENFIELHRKENCHHYIPERPRNLTFQCFHHHLVFMLEKVLHKKEKRIFNNLKTFDAVLTFIKEHFGLTPHLMEPKDFQKYYIQNLAYDDRANLYERLKLKDMTNEHLSDDDDDDDDKDIDKSYKCYGEESDGKFFQMKIGVNDNDLSTIFQNNDKG